MAEDLRVALDAGALAVHYQPLVELRGRWPAAVEALVRWPTPAGGMIGPDRFIPVAEDTGLVVALGEWVLRRACADAVAWHREFGTVLSVNVSPRQLREPGFASVVRRALADSGLPASALMLEITENVLIGGGTRGQQAIMHLAELRAEGVRVALDDFGTGYSSMAYLRDLPIDTVKIDKSFMPSAAAGAAQRTALVRAIVELASGLGLDTVAEGVEDADQAELLTGLGCHLAQGYHFARPAPAAEMAALLSGGHLLGVA
jgi:EAL domain-containing protein (putative c-di-GMP-specific phosphodiesterase class I)